MRTRFVVRGLVQGVNFRTATVSEATRRRLTGRVRNREDGAVEVVAEGDPAAVEALAQWVRRGPRLAEVSGVERTDLGSASRYRDFTIPDGPIV